MATWPVSGEPALRLLWHDADPTRRIDMTRQFGNNGVGIGSEDDVAFDAFVAGLEARGAW